MGVVIQIYSGAWDGMDGMEEIDLLDWFSIKGGLYRVYTEVWKECLLVG